MHSRKKGYSCPFHFLLWKTVFTISPLVCRLLEPFGGYIYQTEPLLGELVIDVVRGSVGEGRGGGSDGMVFFVALVLR